MNADLSYEYNRSIRKVKPEEYSGRVRIYCGIDGVILPFSFDKNYDFSNTEKTFIHYDYYTIDYLLGGTIHTKKDYEKYIFRDNLERLVKLSKHPEIDFVWLTTWRENALIMDQNFGFESVGYLPWDNRMGDGLQIFKKVAIEEDQKLSPSRFIWLDNKANDTHNGSSNLFSKGLSQLEDTDNENRYLSICTTREEGVNSRELDNIFEWVEK